MVYILILMLVSFTFLGYLREKNIYNPLFLMNLMWLIFTVLSFLSFYGIDQPSNKTYGIILLGLASFNFGTLFLNKKFIVLNKKNDKTVSSYRKEVIVKLNYKLLYIMYTIVLVYLVSQSMNVISLLLSGYTMDDIRILFTNKEFNEVRSSSFVANFRGYIATPVVYLSLPILAIDFINGRRDKVLTLLTIGLVALWVLSSGGGRSILLWLMLYFFFAKMIYGKKFSLKLKLSTKIAIVIGMILVLSYMIYMSVERRVDFDIFREIYVYFGVPIIHMEYRLEHIDIYYPSFYSFGLAALNGVSQTILFVLNFFGIINSYPEIFINSRELSFNILEKGINVGGEINNMNAFATIFYQLYLDGRIIGIILGMFLFGWFVGHFYRKMMVLNSDKYVLIYLLLAQKLVFSMVRFYFTQENQTISFILAFFVFTYVYSMHNKPK